MRIAISGIAFTLSQCALVGIGSIAAIILLVIRSIEKAHDIQMPDKLHDSVFCKFNSNLHDVFPMTPSNAYAALTAQIFHRKNARILDILSGEKGVTDA